MSKHQIQSELGRLDGPQIPSSRLGAAPFRPLSESPPPSDIVSFVFAHDVSTPDVNIFFQNIGGKVLYP